MAQWLERMAYILEQWGDLGSIPAIVIFVSLGNGCDSVTLVPPPISRSQFRNRPISKTAGFETEVALRGQNVVCELSRVPIPALFPPGIVGFRCGAVTFRGATVVDWAVEEDGTPQGHGTSSSGIGWRNFLPRSD